MTTAEKQDASGFVRQDQMEIFIRPYQPQDTDAVLKIWSAASEIAHPFLSEAFMREEMLRVRDQHLPNVETWVFERDRKILGFIALAGGTVGGLFVEPDAQRSGVGSMLLDHAVMQRGTLSLDVFKSNRIGRSFYEKYGFALAREHVHEETGETLLHLHYPAPEARA